MIKIKTKDVYDEKGDQRGVILSITDFEHLMESLEDYYDYLFLKRYKHKPEEAVTLEEVKKQFKR